MARLFAFLIGLALAAPLTAQTDVEWKIRREAKENSQILSTLHILSDRYGPRLTGSPNLEAASHWAVEQMTEWGLENAHLEPWNFGHPGWANERLTAHIVSPVKDVLTAELLAWTPGTDGVVRAEVVQIDRPRLPTREELAIYLSTVADKVKDKIVFVGEHETVPVAFDPPTLRRDDAQVLSQYDPVEPIPSDLFRLRLFRRSRIGPRDDGKLDRREVDKAVALFLVENGALVQVNDAARAHGQNPRVLESDLRPGEIAADSRLEKRRLRLHLAPTGRRPHRARAGDREPLLSGRRDRIQRDRGDTGH